MKLIIIAVALWALKAWIEHDPSQGLDPPGESHHQDIEPENWFEYGV